jgi:hypothetical protein
MQASKAFLLLFTAWMVGTLRMTMRLVSARSQSYRGGKGLFRLFVFQKFLDDLILFQKHLQLIYTIKLCAASGSASGYV